jgi:hypothetical protein
MRKPSLSAVVEAVSLVGCSSTKTVTLTPFHPALAFCDRAVYRLALDNHGV